MRAAGAETSVEQMDSTTGRCRWRWRRGAVSARARPQPWKDEERRRTARGSSCQPAPECFGSAGRAGRRCRPTDEKKLDDAWGYLIFSSVHSFIDS